MVKSKSLFKVISPYWLLTAILTFLALAAFSWLAMLKLEGTGSNLLNLLGWSSELYSVTTSVAAETVNSAATLSPPSLSNTALSPPTTLSSPTLSLLLWQNYSLPRIAMAILAGWGLGLATVILQQVTRNHLAADNTLGISAGAQVALITATIFAPSWLKYGTEVVAFGGASVALGLVLLLAWRKLHSTLLIILAGMVIALYLASIATILQLIYPEETRGIAIWAAGSLVQENWQNSFSLFLNLVVLSSLLLVLRKGFGMLALDDTNAKKLGVPLLRLRLIGLSLAAYLTALVVAKVGMLGFIGLISIAIVRSCYATLSFNRLLWLTPLFSALTLVVTDLALLLIQHYWQIEIPTGAVTSLLGTPALLYLMLRSRDHATGNLNSAAVSVTPLATKAPLKLVLLAASAVLAFIISSCWNYGLIPSNWQAEFWSLRLPRLGVASAAAVLLTISGLLLQRLSSNPLASPELLGITAGTYLGMLVTLLVVGSLTTLTMTIGGMLGALVVLALIMLITLRTSLQPTKVLLLGISISTLYDAAQRIFLATNDFRAYSLLSLTSGSTYNATATQAWLLLALAFIVAVVVLFTTRALSLYALQVPVASANGLNIKYTRVGYLLIITLSTTAATLAIGAISFVGLLAPHAAQALGFRKPQGQIIASILIALSIIFVADLLAMQLFYPYELPVGLVATLVGGLYFICFMKKLDS